MEVDKNIQFYISFRGETFLDGVEFFSIKNVHFENYEELVATVARVNKGGISEIESFQLVAEIFALDTKEGWITDPAKACVADINRKLYASKAPNKLFLDMDVIKADPVQKKQVRTSNSADSSNISSLNVKTVHRPISTSEFSTSGCKEKDLEGSRIPTVTLPF